MIYIMVLFTLTGLNVDVGLYEFIEYPTYDFPDISASYYLDLSLNASLFNSVFYFKTTNPDLLDFNNNVRLLFNSSDTIDIDPTSDDYGGNIWSQEIPITYATDQWTRVDDFYNTNKEHEKKPEDFKLRAEQLHGRLLTTSEMINVLNSDSDVSTLLKTKTGISSVYDTFNKRYVCTFNPPQDNYSEGVFEFVNVEFKTIHTESSVQGSSWGADLFTGGDNQRRAALVYYTDYYDYDPGGPEIIKDMAFKCESSYWPDISFSEGIITNDSRSDINNYLPPPSAGGFHYNKNIGVQWLAKNITGGYNNSDLFANEEALVQQYVDLDQIPGNKGMTLETTYSYYRLVIPALTSVGSGNRIGFNILVYYDENGNIITPDDVSVSSTNNGDYSISNSYGDNAFISGHTAYPRGDIKTWISSDLNGFFAGTPYFTNNTAGEWVTFQFNTPIKVSKIKLSCGKSNSPGFRTTSTVASMPTEILIFASNDNSTWNKIGTWDGGYISEMASWSGSDYTTADYSLLDTFEFNYTIFTIKSSIINTLDVSGGTDADPLSNADVGRNNVSREVLLHLLDSDISSNVQRVHNMISDASSAIVDSNGTDISAGDTSNLWIPIEFQAGDTIKFKLTYKPDQITNSSGAAIDGSGNALGTNTIDDQDYIVRLNLI